MNNLILNRSIPVFLLLSVNLLSFTLLAKNIEICDEQKLVETHATLDFDTSLDNDTEYLNDIMEKIDTYTLQIQSFFKKFLSKQNKISYSRYTKEIQILLATMHREIIIPLSLKAKHFGQKSIHARAYKAAQAIYAPLDKIRHTIEKNAPHKGGAPAVVSAVTLGKGLLEGKNELTSAIIENALPHFKYIANTLDTTNPLKTRLAAVISSLEKLIDADGSTSAKPIDVFAALNHRLTYH